MKHILILIAVNLLGVANLFAFEVEAVIKSLDTAQRRISFHATGQDRNVLIPAEVKILDADGKALADGLNAKELVAGAKVILSIQREGDKPRLQVIRLTGKENSPAPSKTNPAPPATSGAEPQQDTSGLTAIPDLGEREYQGFPGGLYPSGKNARPTEHEAAGVALARQVQPLDADGKPSADGKIVLLGIGFSNTVQAFSGFMQVAGEDKTVNPKVQLVNGAVGGMSAARIQNPDDNASGTQYWKTVDERLATASATRAQVQAIWIKETDPGPHDGPFPKYVKKLESELTNIVQILPARFPNAKLVYFSSRTYGGWAKKRPNGTGPGNSEPFSFESGFAYKWLIERQIKGEPDLNFDPTRGERKSPWLSWSAYLWSNGPKPRTDGVFFTIDDFRENDRMHESNEGMRKVGKLLLEFFKNDTTTKGWFVVGSE